jgi:hypothetical protein
MADAQQAPMRAKQGRPTGAATIPTAAKPGPMRRIARRGVCVELL